MNTFVRIENVDFVAAFLAGFTHYRENGSFIEFFDEAVEFVPCDCLEIGQ